MKRERTTRRIDAAANRLRFAGAICALFSAVGIAHGIHAASPTDGWLIPLLAGSAAAIGFALFWCVAIAYVVGMVRLTAITAVFIVSFLVTAVSLGASAQAIATAIAGHSALAAELSEQVDAYGLALNEAYADATSWRNVAESAHVLAVGFKGQADMEGAGQGGAKKGQGVNWGNMQKASDSFQRGAEALDGILDEAKDSQQRGMRQLTDMRNAAARGDQQAFMAAASEITSIITSMNALDPLPVIESTGMIRTDDKGITLSKETDEWETKAKASIADRKVTQVPTYRPLSLGEATRKQVLGSASHGWILAGTIDVMPLLFLIIAFAMSREVWMNESVTEESLTAEGRDEADRSKVTSLMGRK